MAKSVGVLLEMEKKAVKPYSVVHWFVKIWKYVFSLFSCCCFKYFCKWYRFFFTDICSPFMLVWYPFVLFHTLYL